MYLVFLFFFFFKQKTAYEMRISDWSSDVCSSDLFDGKVITGKQPHEINQMGVVRVFQTPEIFPDLTLLQNVMVPAFAKRDGSFRFNAFQRVSSQKSIREEIGRASCRERVSQYV